MHALRLTTRFKEQAYQGEACLLVYDEQHLNGAILSEDVRDQFQSRPATARIYVLAPFLTEGQVRESFLAGALFSRVRSYFHARGGRLFLLTFRDHQGTKAAHAIPFTVDADGNPKEEPPQLVEAELRNGWLFDLFDKYRGRLDAPLGVHFGKSSGKHSDRFLKTSGILLSSAACAAIGYFTLGTIESSQPKRIFVDTAPLIAIAFAIQRIAIKNEIWELEAPVSSFSSYGGMSSLPDPSGKDLILVSASTSGNLVKNLQALDFDEKHIATLFFLESTISSITAGPVICDLTFKRGQSFGYPPIESHPAETCPLCKDGYFLAELEGDQFQLEKRAIKRLAVKKLTQTDDARTSLELLARKDLLKVRLFGARSANSEFTLSADDMLVRVPEIRAKIIRALRRHVPIPLNYVVLVGVRADTFRDLAAEAGIKDIVRTVELVEHADLAGLTPIPSGAALVLFGHLNDFSRARDINAQLRTVVPQGCVCYLSALTIANSVEHLSDLKTFLTYGEHGKDTFTYDAAYSLMLPARTDEISPWESELDLLRQLMDEGKIAPEFESRREVLGQSGDRNKSLFWPGREGELAIKNDFVYLTTGDNPGEISQADIFLTVSNLLASVRADNRGLTAPVLVGKEPIRWHQSVYGHALLDPTNFENYNDAVLRAAFLRAAYSAELQYFSDAHSSARMFSIVQALILGWSKGGGDSLPEVLVSMATGRLSLAASHTLAIKAVLNETPLPEYLKILGSRI